jgi:hypothetical protein
MESDTQEQVRGYQGNSAHVWTGLVYCPVPNFYKNVNNNSGV